MSDTSPINRDFILALIPDLPDLGVNFQILTPNGIATRYRDSGASIDKVLQRKGARVSLMEVFPKTGDIDI